MKIYILPKTGIQESEKYAVERIERELPREWKGYASLEIIEKGRLGREIDLVLLTPDRVLIVELKRWNGQIKSENGYWHLKRPGRDTYERCDTSPVKKNNDKAKILKSIIERTIKSGQSILVDSRVVLCGNSPSPILTEDEKPFVLQLDEFVQIKDERSYKRLLPLPDAWQRKGWSVPSPLDRQNEFELLFRSSSHVRARDFSWQNFKVDGAEIFRHPNDLYREYKAINCDDRNAKALLRRWDFSHLGTAASTQGDWVNIAHRESRVYSFVKSKTDELDGILLSPIGMGAADEVTQDHCELFELPVKQKRLFEFIETYRGKLPFADRVSLVKVLISKFAELHRLGVAHRDIGDHCVWLERPESVRLSGFVAAYFPQMETIGVVKEKVSAITTKLPEDFFDDKHATPFHRDVFLLGVIAHVLLFGEQPTLDESLPKWVALADDPSSGRLDSWFQRALSWDTGQRWSNAGEMLDALNDIELGTGDPVVPLTAFDYFQAQTRVNQYAELSDPEEKYGAEIVKAEREGTICQLKVWYGLKPDKDKPELNHSLLRFLEKAKAIQVNPSEWLPRVVDVGLSNRGLLYAREWLDIPTLRQWLDHDPAQEDRINLALSLLDGLGRLHAINITHGDIHPGNILVRPVGEGRGFPSVVFIDTPDFKSGTEELVTTYYAPANYERISTQERDRYAVVAVVTELVGATIEAPTAGELPIPYVYTEIDECLHIQPAILTLDPLKKALEKALLPPAAEIEQIQVSFQSLPGGIQAGPMLSDNGIYYIEGKYKDAEHDRINLTGPGLQLTFIVETKSKQVKHCNVEKITHSAFQRKTSRAIKLQSLITLKIEPVFAADELISLIYKLPEFVAAIAKNYAGKETSLVVEGHDEEATKEWTEISTRAIWENLIEAEIDALPELLIKEVPRPHPTRPDLLLVPYQCNSVFEYAPDEEVDVYQESNSGESKKVAMLEHRFSNGSEIALRERRMSLNTAVGSRLTLQSKRDRSSYIRRQEAIERILAKQSITPNLIGYFERTASSSDVTVYREPKDDELEIYNIFEGDRRIFSLNEDQKSAFKRLCASGPVSLLQGPPGTGKTDFIAAFLHYVVSNLGAQSVLLVSQSHEATNNALERVLDLADRTSLKLDVVRVGEDGVLSDPIKHVGVSAVQESFRERFRSQFKHRVTALSTRLLLNRGFVEEYCDSMFHLSRLADDIAILSADLDKIQLSEDRSGIEQRIRSRKEIFWAHVSLVSEIDQSLEIQDALTLVEQALIEKYQIRNPSAVVRLNQLIRISREWIDVLGSDGGNFAEFLAKTRTIVAGTCVGVGRWNLGVSKNTYDWVIVDEAARATPSELAVSMQVGQRILLVGDHFQLPPFYKDELRLEMSKRMGVSRDSDVFDSDFERAFESEYGKVVGASLLTQYRMAPAIGHLVSESFYKPRGKVLKQGRPGPKDFYKALPPCLQSEVIWIDTTKAAQDSYEANFEVIHQKDRRNPFESKVVIDVLRQLLTCEPFVEALLEDINSGVVPIGIIAMYASQVKEIERDIARSEWIGELRSLIKVDTVDSYQGKENRIVILSLVRNNPKHKQGFLSSPNRLNVAMSRAMDRLVIVGASGMWREANRESPLATVLKHIEANAIPGLVEILESSAFRS